MAQETVTQRDLKQAVKDALAEILQEQRGLLHEVFTEALEDFALTEAIRAGRKTEPASRDEVERALRS